MDASVITALAALFGAAIGGLTSVLASWLTQQTQTRTQWLAQDKLRRQELYKEFIEEASKCYFDALQHDKADIPALVGLYAKIGRMRFLSSSKVGRSTFFAISVRSAAQKSSRCALNNSETKGAGARPAVRGGGAIRPRRSFATLPGDGSVPCMR